MWKKNLLCLPMELSEIVMSLESVLVEAEDYSYENKRNLKDEK